MSEEQSLGEQESEIRQAWEASQQPRVEVAYSYILEAYDDYVIVEVDNKAWKVTYQRTDDGIIFAPSNEWQEVEQKREWIAKTGNTLKAVSKTDNELRVANYIVVFGGRDLEGTVNANKNPDGTTGEFFTQKTLFDSAYTSTGHLLVDWEHGEGKAVDGSGAPGGDDILGYVDWKTANVDDGGLWVERVLNRRSKYVQYLETLIDAGMIGTSSEAIPHQVQKAATGEITSWPLRRDTFTVSPMEPRMMQGNVLQAAKALGLYTEPTEQEPEAQPEADNTAVEAARATLAQFETELFIMET